MTLWFLVLAGCILPFVIATLVVEGREARGRLAGMIFGLYLSGLGVYGTVLVAYASAVSGAVSIGRAGRYADLTFADQPVLAVLVVLLLLSCTACFTAFGWSIFKGARDRTLGA